MLNLKIKKCNSKEDFIKTVIEETKDIAEQCETIALKNNMKDIEDSILEVISLDSMDNKAIYDEYRYKIWNNLPSLVQKYLCKRFNLEFQKSGVFRYVPPCTRIARKEEPVGVALEKYVELSNTKKIKNALSAFSTSDLTDIFCVITEEINKRKVENVVKEDK